MNRGNDLCGRISDYLVTAALYAYCAVAYLVATVRRIGSPR